MAELIAHLKLIMPHKYNSLIVNAITELFSNHSKEIINLCKSGHRNEKWFQFEIAKRLETSSIKSVSIEQQIKFDGRKKNTKDRIKNGRTKGLIDIALIPKHVRRDPIIGIELKHGADLGNLYNLLEDIIKLHAVCLSEWQFRSLYFVLIFENNNQRESKYSNILHSLKQIKPECCYDLSFNEIGNLRVVIVCWESSFYKTSSSIESFNTWYSEIENIMRRYNIYNNIISSPREFL